MSFFNKYLKYKTKYLALQQAFGGAWNCDHCTFENKDDTKICEICEKTRSVLVSGPVSGPVSGIRSIPYKTFYIYTTGICDWGYLDAVANAWNTILRANILRSIHPSFNQIIIRHFDPLIEMGNSNEPMSKSITDKIITEFNGRIVHMDFLEGTFQREIKSEFIHGKINFNHIENPHLLLDLAHIFKYLPTIPKLIQISGHYGEVDKPHYYHINSVYPGYCGNTSFTDYGYSNQFIIHSNFFMTDIDGNVVTFIDRLYKQKYHMDTGIRFGLTPPIKDFIHSDPSVLIKYIYLVIRNKSIQYLKSKGIEYAIIDPAIEKLFINEFSKNIVMEIINLLMNVDLNMDELIDKVYDLKVRKAIKLLNSELI
jgi:hypothetical protein